MGRCILQFDDLGTPLARVDERVIHVPRGRRLVVNNSIAKVVVLLAGRFRALVNGTVVGDLQPGDALVIPGPCNHVYQPLEARRETRLHALVLSFTPGLFACDPETMRAVPVGGDAERSRGDFIREHFGSVQVRRGVLTASAMEWVDALRREGEREGLGQRLRAAAYGLLLLTEIARRHVSADAPKKKRAAGDEPRRGWTVEQVKNFVLEHHAEPLTLEQIAWHVGLSAEHLARGFRRETGLTIFGYVEQVRLEHAKTLLASSTQSVTEIARQAGFGTPSQLCRSFKRALGETPLAYRLRTTRAASFSPSLFEEVVL